MHLSLRVNFLVFTEELALGNLTFKTSFAKFRIFISTLTQAFIIGVDHFDDHEKTNNDEDVEHVFFY